MHTKIEENDHAVGVVSVFREHALLLASYHHLNCREKQAIDLTLVSILLSAASGLYAVSCD